MVCVCVFCSITVGESFLFYFCMVRFCTACSEFFVWLPQIGLLGHVLQFFKARTRFRSYFWAEHYFKRYFKVKSDFFIVRSRQRLKMLKKTKSDKKGQKRQKRFFFHGTKPPKKLQTMFFNFFLNALFLFHLF